MKDNEVKLLAEEILLQKIVSYIEEVPSADLRDIRAAFGMEAAEFTKLFRKYLNISPTEYLRKERIKRAKRLLRKTEKSVAEISAECGMDPSAMGTMFRTYVGCNPTDYRRQYLRKKFQRDNKQK